MFSTEDLLLAFGWHMVVDLFQSDHDLTASERAFLQEHFPTARMVAAGFKGAHGALTERYFQARDQALIELPTRLDPAQRQAQLGMLARAMMVDGEYAPAEGTILYRAGTLLGASDVEVDDLLSSLDLLSDLELPEADH